MFIATLIAAEKLSPGDISCAADALAAAGVEPGSWRWIDEGRAADVPFAMPCRKSAVTPAQAGVHRPASSPAGSFAARWMPEQVRHDEEGALAALAAARGAVEGLSPPIDAIVQVEAERVRRLLVADMDSTMITVECIDELADYAGLKPQVAEVTERAMRGELDFAEALAARVALLMGLDAGAIDRCHAERVRIMPGARALVRTMRAKGGRAVLVSGGFTAFADRVGAEIGFDRVIANRLEVAGGVLAGTVAAPIVDADTKLRTLIAEREAAGLSVAQTLAVGDGANDIPMIRAAGLGVAYRAKPATAAAAGARVDAGDLTALLYAQGWGRGEWSD